MKIHRVALCFILLQISSIFAQELAGCGGFVKSSLKDTKLDYSSIKVKIVTKEGALKEVTEVAPTGYYYIPIYDKGTFYVKVSGPEGYHFEPSQVEVLINEENKCLANSQSEQDINFRLTGFTVFGHVTSDSCSGGPADIQVEIPDVAKTTTDSTGHFTLTNVPPGSYKVLASHPQYTFQTSQLDAVIQSGNLQLPQPFTIKGYSISGTVLSSGSPVRNVEFYLYTTTAYRCPVPAGSDAQCVATTSETGTFTFQDVPCGVYRLTPVYSTFDVIPKEKVVEVTSGNVEIEEKFVVKGFSLNGRVVSGDKGVAGVTIKVNGAKTHVTDNNGYYTLDQLNNGVYTIQAEKEHFHFTEISNLRISPSTAPGELPNITVKSYDVCGKILLSQVPAGVSISAPRSVVLQDLNGNEVSRTNSDSNGAFCFVANSGSYKVAVSLSKQEQQLGLLVNPPFQQVTVTYSPVLDILFSQARVTVSGTVSCLSSPCDVTVSMTTASSHLTSTLVDNTFTFQNVLPGTYQVQVENSKWCWNHDSVPIEVSTDDILGIEFVQTGYRAEIQSDQTINVEIDGKDSKLQKGKNSICVGNTGKHTLKPKEKCFKFSQDTYTFDSSSETIVSVTHYKISGSFKSDIQDLSIEISPTRPVEIKGREYSFWGEHQETYTISPKSPTLLFYPSSHKITVNKENCLSVPEFDARPGIYIDASVEPAMEGVVFSVRAQEDASFVREVLSGASGKVHIGPLYDTMNYKLSAAKDGYMVTQKSATLFSAKKLGRVMVNIQENSTPIAGALLSLSGEGYRSNNMTNNDGKFSFMNLNPGDYYLRPVLKEYVFEPSSVSITVTDGGDHSVTIKATRVAYSAYGAIKTLAGEPEKQITVEAIGDSGEYEQTQTDSNGQFRIRGLVPNKKYRIVAKAGERTSPSEISETMKSQDITNLEFIVFKKNSVKVYGTVNTPAEHISSVQLVLKGEDSQEISQLTVANYFEFKNVKNGNYKLIAKSNLNSQYYEHSVQEIPVIVENDDVHVTVNYTISVKSEHLHDVSAAPVFALFFGAALIAVIFYNAQIMQFIKDAREGKYAIGRNTSNVEVDDKSEWIPGLNPSNKNKQKSKKR